MDKIYTDEFFHHDLVDVVQLSHPDIETRYERNWKRLVAGFKFASACAAFFLMVWIGGSIVLQRAEATVSAPQGPVCEDYGTRVYSCEG